MGTRTNSAIALALCLMILPANSVFAWKSGSLWFPNTHGTIATNALSLFSVEYPDITYFSQQLINGSADENTAHGFPPTGNGGNPGELWKEVDKEYKKDNYSKAYKTLGAILHLVQDMGTSTHAFDIPHGIGIHDDELEKYAGDNYANNTPSVQNGDEPIAFYGNIITATINMVNGDLVTPPASEHWSEYWQPGQYGFRPFPPELSSDWWKVQHHYLMRDEITRSINYAAGCMAAASRILPPLVKDIDISPADPERGGLH
jgi:hypothetical protein